MISNFVKSGKLKRITALDPAKPLFIFANKNHKLGKDDAEFVDVIHTDVLQRGVLAPCGHADFYVNGGIVQHGCELEKCKFPLYSWLEQATKAYIEFRIKHQEAAIMTEHQHIMRNQ